MLQAASGQGLLERVSAFLENLKIQLEAEAAANKFTQRQERAKYQATIQYLESLSAGKC